MNSGEEKHTVGELYAIAAKLVEKELTKYKKDKLSPAEKNKAELIGKVLSQYALKGSDK